MRIHVSVGQRAVLHLDEVPKGYLRPGVHRAFYPFRTVRVDRYTLANDIADLSPEQLAVVPAGEVTVVDLSAHQRALVRRSGRPVRWLGPGLHHVWTCERIERRDRQGNVVAVPVVAIEVFDTSGLATDPLAADVARIAPDSDYVETTVPHGFRGLRYVDGALDSVLEPGRHASWCTQHKVTFSALEIREQVLDIHGQEVMTKDRVSLRLNISATYEVADVARVASVSRSPRDLLYLAVQLAARESIASRSLDELLGDRDAVGDAIAPRVQERAEAVGLRLVSLGLKDVVLPGEMKRLLNQVIEARKQAEASVILRREEVAATRSLAKTAEVLAENPILVRLKELEAYKELAEKVGKIDLIVAPGEGVKGLKLL